MDEKRCIFCKRSATHVVEHHSYPKDGKANVVKLTEVFTCKTHAKKGRQIAAQRHGGRDGHHTRAQRINAARPIK